MGDEFWSLVDDALIDIEVDPHRFAKSEFATDEVEFRYAYVKRFRHVIHFAVETTEIVVVAVTHAARKPGYWISRINIE